MKASWKKEPVCDVANANWPNGQTEDAACRAPDRAELAEALAQQNHEAWERADERAQKAEAERDEWKNIFTAEKAMHNETRAEVATLRAQLTAARNSAGGARRKLEVTEAEYAAILSALRNPPAPNEALRALMRGEAESKDANREEQIEALRADVERLRAKLKDAKDSIPFPAGYSIRYLP